MSRLRISLFGRFYVEHNGKPYANGLDARKVQELFGYLLLYRNRTHSRETLADLLWGDNSSAQARKYLRQALWQLQSALKIDENSDHASGLVVDSDWVGVNDDDDIWFDVASFENAYEKVQGKAGKEIDPESARELVKAVDLHRGSLLEGWYHDWCIFERERLQSMYLAMLNKLMTYFEAQRQFETGITYGQKILQSDRAHERTHWRMMRLHYLAGDRTAALRQYQRCVAALEQELGVVPAKWTMSLYEQIKADQLDEASDAPRYSLTESTDVLAPTHANKLQALLNEFHQEVQQYIQASGLTSKDKREADLYPAE